MSANSPNPGRGTNRGSHSCRSRRNIDAILTARTFQVQARPSEMGAQQIASLRRETLGVSQKLFADLLNVSVHTVHAWEQGHREPSGCALRLLYMAEQDPKRLLALVEEARSAAR